MPCREDCAKKEEAAQYYAASFILKDQEWFYRFINAITDLAPLLLMMQR